MRQLTLPGLLLAEAIVGFCALAFELCVARLVAPYAGMSTDTWTAIIVAFLGAWGAGNHLGGRLAASPDRRIGPTAAVVATLGAVGVALAPDLAAAGDRWIVALAPMDRWRLVLLAGLPCLPAGFCFGIASPLLMTAVIRTTRGSGLAIGLAAATGAAGSGLGAIALLWLLLDALGARGACTAIALLAMLAAALLLALSGRIDAASRAARSAA